MTTLGTPHPVRCTCPCPWKSGKVRRRESGSAGCGHGDRWAPGARGAARTGSHQSMGVRRKRCLRSKLGGKRCHAPSPLTRGGGTGGCPLQKVVPPPWQTRRNFPERFPPLFTLHIISVFVQRVPDVIGLLCGWSSPPSPVLVPGTGGRAWAAPLAADPRAQHVWSPQLCQTLSRTAGLAGHLASTQAPFRPHAPNFTRDPGAIHNLRTQNGTGG